MSEKAALRIISLGWGVQSFALAAMSALGELPPVDAAVHSDTTHERQETYEFAAKWAPWLEERGVRVVTVRASSKTTNLANGRTPPLFTLSDNDGSKGMLRRTCTHRWKVTPQRRWISAELKRQHLKKTPGIVEHWFGISRDEWTRMRDSDVKYICNAYPFMQQFEPPMTRKSIKGWLQDRGLEIPVKSACIFCPYHDAKSWHDIKVGNNGDWGKAVVADMTIRDRRPGYKCFVHPSCISLDQVNIRPQFNSDYEQLELWGEECTGNCFL